MKGKPFKKLITLVAPYAATVAAGLGGPLAGSAVKFIAGALGVDPTPEAVEAKLISDPTSVIELDRIEADYKKSMAQADIDVFALQTADVQDARDLAKDTGLWPQVTLSVLYTVGYFGILGMLISGEWTIPESGRELIAGLIGVLTALQVKVGDFWLGSSAGSKAKDRL